MFFKKILSKMKNFVVIKYRTTNFIDNIKVSFDKDTISMKNDPNDMSNNSHKLIDFKQIYYNRMGY